MSPKSHHGHSKQGDTPGVRSRHGHFWKESSPEIQRVPPFWILPFRSLLTIPSRSTPLGPALPNHTLRINPTPCAPWCHSFLPLWSQLRGPRGVFQLRAMLVGLEATGPDSSCDAGPGPGKPQAEAPGRGTRLRPVPGLAVAGCQHRLPWLRAKGLQTVQAQNKKFHFRVWKNLWPGWMQRDSSLGTHPALEEVLFSSSFSSPSNGHQGLSGVLRSP